MLLLHYVPLLYVIISIVRGSLAHKDSMGNHEILGRGSVQFTSAGTGIRHSEFNASQREMVHFVQIWVTPHARSLKPNYQTVEYEEKERINRLALLVAPCGTETKVHGKHAVISQDFKAYACVLQVDHTITYTVPGILYMSYDCSCRAVTCYNTLANNSWTRRICTRCSR
jgi:redox-sensitive bicupin YhaK (pirin superfamily)